MTMIHEGPESAAYPGISPEELHEHLGRVASHYTDNHRVAALLETGNKNVVHTAVETPLDPSLQRHLNNLAILSSMGVTAGDMPHFYH